MARPKILLVEDNATFQFVMRSMADLHQWHLTIASSAEEALELFNVHRFSVVLMDIRLGSIDGIECAKRMRNQEARWALRTPIIALTACAMAEDRERCLSVGMDDYLSKPFEMRVLAELVQKWCTSNRYLS